MCTGGLKEGDLRRRCSGERRPANVPPETLLTERIRDREGLPNNDFKWYARSGPMRRWGARVGEVVHAGVPWTRFGAGMRSGGPRPTLRRCSLQRARLPRSGLPGRVGLGPPRVRQALSVQPACRRSIDAARGARSVEARRSAPATADGGRDARLHNHRIHRWRSLEVRARTSSKSWRAVWVRLGSVAPAPRRI